MIVVSPIDWIVGAYDDWAYDPLSALQPFAGAEVKAFAAAKTKSYSFFGEINFGLSEDIDLTLGLRWTNDECELVGRTEADNPIGANVLTLPFNEDESWSELTYRAALNYHFNDDVLGYLSYNRGFKVGAYNTVVFTGVPAPAVEPEILDTYEVGMKAEFLDGRLHLNTAFFYYDYSNIQLQKISGTPPGSFLQNAAESDIYGFEVDGQAALSDNLTLRFGLSLLNTEYVDYPGCEVSTPPATYSVTFDVFFY
jgi:iron complex outermembrane recepter protein